MKICISRARCTRSRSAISRVFSSRVRKQRLHPVDVRELRGVEEAAGALDEDLLRRRDAVASRPSLSALATS
jgi:hypothetical protein